MAIAVNTILLISTDERLVLRVQRALLGAERLVRCQSGELPSYPDVLADHLIVVDCRALDRKSMSREIRRVREVVGAEARCAAIMTAPSARNIDVDIVATIRDHVTDVTLFESDSVGDIIRAVLNDMSQTAAAAIALSALTRRLPTPAHKVPCAVLGSGLRASSVKEVAALLQVDRGTLCRGLRHETGYTAAELIDLSKACYAVAMLRGSPLPLATILRAARYTEARWLNSLLRRVFDLSIDQVRDASDDRGPAMWLTHKLAATHSSS
jgi:hypothetical protein